MVRVMCTVSNVMMSVKTWRTQKTVVVENPLHFPSTRPVQSKILCAGEDHAGEMGGKCRVSMSPLMKRNSRITLTWKAPSELLCLLFGGISENCVFVVMVVVEIIALILSRGNAWL